MRQQYFWRAWSVDDKDKAVDASGFDMERVDERWRDNTPVRPAGVLSPSSPAESSPHRKHQTSRGPCIKQPANQREEEKKRRKRVTRATGTSLQHTTHIGRTIPHVPRSSLLSLLSTLTAYHSLPIETHHFAAEAMSASPLVYLTPTLPPARADERPGSRGRA